MQKLQKPVNLCRNCDAPLEDGRKRYCCCRFVAMGGVKCVAPESKNGWCQFHFYKANRGFANPTKLEPCRVPRCGKLSVAAANADLCRRHLDKARRWGLSRARLVRLYTDAHSCCESCGFPEGESLAQRNQTLAIDHDHRHCKKGCSECIVGLLCSVCNNARIMNVLNVAEYVLRKCRSGELDMYREGADQILNYIQNEWSE